jgi:uncharacterized protein YqjF (DUF2071 family)
VRCHWELLKVEFRHRIGQGRRESRDAITRYGILFLALIGMQSDKILQARCKFKFPRIYTKIMYSKKGNILRFPSIKKFHISTTL